VTEPGSGTFIGPLAASSGAARGAAQMGARADVRHARLIHRLGRGGYRLEQIAPLIAQVREAGGPEPLGAALRDWHDRLSARGRAMPTGAAGLEAYLCERG
jgi:hypothetical protein